MIAIVSGDYTTFKHVKTRKVVVLEIEVPEERFQEVISKLGMPIGGESKPVAVALLDTQIASKPDVVGNSDVQQSDFDGYFHKSKMPPNYGGVAPLNDAQQTEGDKLRVRAVMLCRDLLFQSFLAHKTGLVSQAPEERARNYILNRCMIISRSELTHNLEAQAKFRELLAKFDSWKLQNQYQDNLNRI